MRTDGTPASSIESGDFPYPLSSGPQESCYLRWLRNHSNYMATRGLLDYFRIAGVLARGILLNFSIVLPMLLAALDSEGSRLAYLNAGHNPGLLIRGDGSVEQLSSAGLCCC